MPDNDTCACDATAKLIFACSGAADVGEITDRAARRLTAEGEGKMFCLAGIGGRVSGIMKAAQAADAIVTLDGCRLDCAKICLEQAGFSDFGHVRASDIGMDKGKSPPTNERIAALAQRAAAVLATTHTV